MNREEWGEKCTRKYLWPEKTTVRGEAIPGINKSFPRAHAEIEDGDSRRGVPQRNGLLPVDNEEAAWVEQNSFFTNHREQLGPRGRRPGPGG